MKVMNDDLIVRLSITCTFGATIWLCMANSMIPGRPSMQKVCTILIDKKGGNLFEITRVTSDPSISFQ